MKNSFKSISFATALVSLSFFGQSFRPNSEGVIVPQGTPIRLTLNQNISSDDVEIGSVLEFSAADGVIVEGKEVITHDAPAEGVVTALDRNDGCSKCDTKFQHIEIKVTKVKAVDGKNIWLYGRPLLVRGKCAKCPVQLNTTTTVNATVQATVRVMVK
jgi:hypothetical protein